MTDLDQVRRWSAVGPVRQHRPAPPGRRDRHRPRPLPRTRRRTILPSSGMAAWDALLGQFDPLPPSPRATSRDDGISGIRLYRVPSGWKGAGILPAAPVCEGHPLPDGREARPGNLVSPGEVIQHHHRYMVAPPSVHPSGRPYRWLGGNLPRRQRPSPPWRGYELAGRTVRLQAGSLIGSRR